MRIRKCTMPHIKVKAIFTLEQGMKAQRGSKRYSSTLSLTLALDEDGWSTPRHGRFTA